MSYGDVHVSRDFRLGEFSVSEEHPDLVESIPEEHQPAACRLIVTCLQPLRAWVGRSITVLSGYRSEQLNEAVDGSPTSQHLRAEAADLSTMFARSMFEALMRGRVHAPCGQVVYYPSRRFVHLALPSARYPVPTFCIHDPPRGWIYRPLDGVDELRRLLG